jgi:RNA polymerase sigma-70 factor (ECF subfamily)
MLPDCVGNSRCPVYGQSVATTHDQLVYAVYETAERTCRSERASRDATDHGFVEENVSDEMLLKHVAAGDNAAMHIMFSRHRKRVFHFIQRMVRNPAVAEDLVSQVFLDVWRSANRFESRAKVSTWLLAIARFKAINSLRRRGGENVDQDDIDEIADAGETPEAALDRKERNGILRSCIDRLPAAHREIIDLFYYHEKSIAEVSALIGIPDGTAKSRLSSARKQLARVLVNAGFGAAAVQTSADEAVL